MINSNSTTSVTILNDSNKKPCENHFIHNIDINMYRLLRLIHITAKFFGLMSFSINYDLNKYPQNAFLSIYDIFAFLFFICLRTFSIWNFFTFFQLNFSTTIYIFLRGVTIICTILFLILIIDSICDVINRKKILKIYQNITLIDSNLNLFGIKFNNGKHFYVIVMTTIFLMLAGTLQNLCTAYVYSNYISSRSIYISFYRLGIEILFNYGIAILVKNYLLCFVYVNSRLKSIKHIIANIQCQRKSQNIQFQMKMLQQIYDDLVDLVDDANQCFSFQVSFFIEGVVSL